MSGMTISTPRSSASGNIMPASIKIMSSPERRTIMFMPNSPSPPRGIAKREGLSNVAHVLMSDPSSYHTGAREIEEARDAITVASILLWAENAELGDSSQELGPKYR